jgi:hypothetical protein
MDADVHGETCVKRRVAWAVAAGVVAVACNGTTGDALYTFPAYAAGAQGAGDPFSANGYTIQLTLAQMYVGAVYVNEAPAGSGGTFDTPVCIDPGVYAAQVPGGTEVDLLSSTPQAWTSGTQGSGSADLGPSWEIYLTDGDVNAPDNAGPNTVDLQGTATRESDGTVFTFAATVNINQTNDGLPEEDPAQPGLNPICKQRILELGGIALTLAPDVAMLLTIDPRAWFSLPIDFSTLPSVASASCTEFDPNTNYGSASFCIPDSINLPGAVVGAQQGHALYEGIFTGGTAAYSLAYVSNL